MRQGNTSTPLLSRVVPVFALVLGIPLSATASPSTRFLVICSPGSPGTTAQAQPTLDAFARAAGRSAGWPDGTVAAAYFETAEAGLARLAQPDAILALVPPPFLDRYGKELGLKPRMEAVLESGKPEIWSLVARKGRISSAAALKGWEVAGAPGYAPDFVRNTLLKNWGSIPADARITFTPRLLTALRRAAAGEDVAVLLDTAGSEALASLPFAGDLETVARSRPLPGAFLCTVGNRLPGGEADALFRGLSRLPDQEGGAEVLQSLRLSRFAPLGWSAAQGETRAGQGAAPGSKP